MRNDSCHATIIRPFRLSARVREQTTSPWAQGVILAAKKRQNECCKVSGSASRHRDRVLLWRIITMRVPNDLQLDNEAYLLFSAYYTSSGIGNTKTAASYLKEFEVGIQGAGQVLGWLGYATPDKSSPLGWKPSQDLISLISNPRRRWPPQIRKISLSAQRKEAYDTMMEAALGDVMWFSDLRNYVASLMELLGLVTLNDLGQVIPKRRLCELVAERRQEERDQRYEQRGLESM
jgi:hypothetical protein